MVLSIQIIKDIHSTYIYVTNSFFLGHLSHSGDLLLWVGVRRHASSVVRRPLTFFSQELLGQSLSNLVCSICRVTRQEVVNYIV